MRYFRHASTCVALVALLSFIAAPTTALSRELFDGRKAIQHGFLDALESGSTAGGYPIVPTGDQQQMLHLEVTSSTGLGSGLPLGRAHLISVRNNALSTAINMQVNLEQDIHIGEPNDDPCKRDDFLWKRSTGGRFRDMNCASINHMVNFFKNPTGKFQQYLVYAREKNWDIPPTVLYVEFSRFQTMGRTLRVRVYINPEQYGFSRDNETVWGAATWHKSFIARDPAKVEFVENLSRWATDVQNRIDKAFNKDRDAYAGLLPLATYFAPKETTAPSAARPASREPEAPQRPATQAANPTPTTQATTAPAVDADLERDLLTLKSLFERGLLTKSQYDDGVRKALESKLPGQSRSTTGN